MPLFTNPLDFYSHFRIFSQLFFQLLISHNWFLFHSKKEPTRFELRTLFDLRFLFEMRKSLLAFPITQFEMFADEIVSNVTYIGCIVVFLVNIIL